jgi:toxin ParE1/3/4
MGSMDISLPDPMRSWVEDQADHHADGFFALFDLLAAFPEMARERAAFTPPVWIHPSGAHLVLYRPVGQGGEIIRLRYAQQTMMAYLLEG